MSIPFGRNCKMLIITQKIRNVLKEKKLSENKLSQIIEYHSGSLNKIIRGEKPFPEDKIQKIAPILEVSPDEIKGWVLADKYSKEIIERALDLKQELIKEDELILTLKIHEIMKARNLNITAFSREISYNQGLLSQVVLGNKSVSKKLVLKLSEFSGISEDEIKSWIVADKYSAEVLRAALDC